MLLQQGLVGFKSARVSVEVFVRAKLRGVYENTDNYFVALFFGCFNEAHMPSVKVAHSGHETNAGPFLLPCFYLCSYVANEMYGVHSKIKNSVRQWGRCRLLQRCHRL